MNDFNQMHALYHSDMAKKELERRKRNYEVINRDFLDDLPLPIRDVMDRLRWDYGNRPWFSEAWEKYRKMVLEAGLGGKIKMPGVVFNEYFDKYELKELEKIYGGKNPLPCSECVAYHSDMYMDEYLEHHGIKGQKWGVRRYQNEDGTLTAEGRVRYGASSSSPDSMSEAGKQVYKLDRKNALKDAQKERKELSKTYGKEIADKMVKDKFGAITAKDLTKADKNSEIGKSTAKGAAIVGGIIAALAATPYVVWTATVRALDR